MNIVTVKTILNTITQVISMQFFIVEQSQIYSRRSVNILKSSYSAVGIYYFTNNMLVTRSNTLDSMYD